MNTLDRRSNLVRALESAADETLLRDAWVEFPASDATAIPGNALKNLLGLTKCKHAISVPLRQSDGRKAGVMLIQFNGIPADASATREMITAISNQVGLGVALFQRLDGHTLTSRYSTLWTRVKSAKFVISMAAIAVTAAAMFISMPYNIDCACELQPVVRRYVAAPYDGKLKQNLVEEGDIVTSGQPLAHLDEKEIHWDLAGVIAEYNKAVKERDAALAKQDAPAAQKARLEMKRLALTREMLENRDQNLTLESPIDGVVIRSELEHSEGAPLEVGQVLFEIAPLHEMIVELAIPESEVRYARAEMDATIQLDAFPGEEWQARVIRVHPRAELKDNDSVFIAEVRVDNADNRLRPGMKGEASLYVKRRSLGWVLFHKPWHAARSTLGW